ncbi:MAG: YciC family protein [Candidatus Neomarinimicrobiota bacterium]|jgi:hypothetical protein
MFTVLPAFKYGWQEIQKKLMLFLVLTLIFSAADIVSSYLLKDIVIDENMDLMQISEILPVDTMLKIAGISFALLILNFFVVVLVLARLKAEKPTDYLKRKFKLFPNYILLMILKMLAIGLGLMFFIVPGIVLLLALYFMEYLFIDKEMPILDTFKASWDITKGYRVGIFFFEFNLYVLGMFLAFPQTFWPNTMITYILMVLINLIWLPFSWSARGFIYKMVWQAKTSL